MKRLAIVPACVLLVLAAEAAAGPRIVTPPLSPLADGRLLCQFANASNKKEVQVRIYWYDLFGNTTVAPAQVSLGPNESAAYSSGNDQVRLCVIEVIKGGKKNVRVSLTAIDANDIPLAAVGGQ